MFEILIVEDNTEKLREILQLLDTIEGIQVDSVDSEIDVMGAKKRLKNKSYDLLILDIAVPLRKSEEVDLEGGLKLLRELNSRSGYLIPTHIIGLTGRDEILEKAENTFGKQVLSVIYHSYSSVEWEQKLVVGIKQRIFAKDTQLSCEKDYDYDVAIICALKSELDANRNNGWDWKSHQVNSDDTNYYRCEFKNSDNKSVRVVAAHADRMGMPAASALAMKLIMQFRPKYIVMTGIMAGVSGRVSLGDIVVSSPVWDWGSGKWISNSGGSEAPKSLFQLDPFQFTLESGILKQVNLLSDDDDFLFALRKSYQGSRPKTDIDVHVGPVATGASVLSDKNLFNSIKEQHRKLLGVEMEAYGLFSAADIAPRPKPTALCIKSVVDFGDSDKDDDYQHYGAFISANFAKEIILRLV